MQASGYCGKKIINCCCVLHLESCDYCLALKPENINQFNRLIFKEYPAASCGIFFKNKNIKIWKNIPI